MHLGHAMFQGMHHVMLEQSMGGVIAQDSWTNSTLKHQRALGCDCEIKTVQSSCRVQILCDSGYAGRRKPPLIAVQLQDHRHCGRCWQACTPQTQQQAARS